MKKGETLLLVPVAAALLLSVGVFVVDPGTTPEPVKFEDTVRMGMSNADIRQAKFEGYEVPRAQVFYSQYGFVVGYTGIDSFARNLREEEHEGVLGVPTKAYVTDFSGTNPSPVEGGFVSARGSPEWTDAEDAVYVVDSGASAGEGAGDDVGGAVVPFSSTEDAERYAKEYGGEVRNFGELLETEFESPDIRKTAEEVVERRSERADEKVREAHELLDRNVSVTVGEDAETVQAAVDAAPNGTAVRIPAGIYKEHIVIDKPLTLVGEEGARISGRGNGTVMTVEADDVAISSLNISGVGNDTRGESGRDAGWDSSIEEAYGGSDTGVHFNNTSLGLVHDTQIDTNATGVLFSDTEGGVVTETTVNGSEEWMDGFMGVLVINSPAVVQNSTFYGGRDSVYSHASDGLVVRDSYMERGRFGVHLMYTSNTLLRGNTVRGKGLAGIIIMTRPTGNYVVGNDVRRSQNGIATGGSRSYFAGNVVVDNEYGMKMGASSSVYTRNVLAHNSVGARASSIIPSNEVVENDFVENEVQVTAAKGSMRIWSEEGRGNYWSNAPPGANVFRPTHPVDSSVTKTDGMVTVRRSPAYTLLRSLETVVPGARSSGIVDKSPLREPAAYDGSAAQSPRTDPEAATGTVETRG